MRRAAVVLVIEVVATLVLLTYAPWELAVILGWDVGAAVFLATTGHMIIRADAADTEMLASEEDGTRTAGAFVLVSACTVSLLGVGFAIRLAGHSSGEMEFRCLSSPDRARSELLRHRDSLRHCCSRRHEDLQRPRGGARDTGNRIFWQPNTLINHTKTSRAVCSSISRREETYAKGATG